MKKTLCVLGCALCAAFAIAGDYFPLSVSVPAGRTFVTNYIDMARIGAGQIDRVSVAAIGASTGVVTVASCDLGIAETALLNSPVGSTNTVVTSYPRWSASENLNATNQLYSARKLRVIVNQATNAVAERWEIGVYTK